MVKLLDSFVQSLIHKKSTAPFLVDFALKCLSEMSFPLGFPTQHNIKYTGLLLKLSNIILI
jgi:hypothetical protein